MTEHPTPGQIRAAIKAQLSTAPPSVDANGVSREEYAARREALAATVAATEPVAPANPAPPQVGMRPNPAQGHGGAPAPMQHGGSTLDRIKATAKAAGDALFDGGSAA
jgi:hypothetical protein